jgi:MFS family permease
VGVVALAAATVVAARLPDLVPESQRVAPGEVAALRPTLRSTVRDHRTVFLTLGLGVVLISAVRATRQVVIPLWADQLALAPSVVSLIYGVSAGLDMLVFYPAGKVMDRRGRLWVVVPSMLIMGCGLLLMPLTHSATALLVVAAAIGFGNGIGSGVIMTLGADHSPRQGRAHFLGIWRLMADIGSSCGPALLSFLTAALSLDAGIAATGLLALAAAAQLGYWIPRNRRKSSP